jgi:hypothetical protein
MLRTVPKHKGTEHLQADIKTRIKELTEELAGPKKGASRTGPAETVRPEGAGQLALVGPPNSGKSTLHATTTGSHTVTGPYPFTTQVPLPGMFPYEDIAFQLVDLPPVCKQHPVPWLGNALRPADGCLLVVDLSDPGCVDAVAELHEVLAERRVVLTERWDPPGEELITDDEDDDPFAIRLPTLLVGTKADQLPHLDEELAVFEELGGYGYEAIAVSGLTGDGLDQIGAFLFSRLETVRVYTKLPGKPPDLTKPFTLRRGQTVEDVATLIHKEVAGAVSFARLWRDGVEGRQIGRGHPLEDRDVIELHMH